MQSNPYQSLDSIFSAIKNSQLTFMGLKESTNDMVLLFDTGLDIFNLVFEGTKDFSFSPFDKENTVLNLVFHKMDEHVPIPLVKKYPVLKKYKGKRIVTAHLQSKKGMSGVIVFKIIKYNAKRRVNKNTTPTNPYTC